MAEVSYRGRAASLLRALGYVWASPTVALALIFWLLPLWIFQQLRPARFRGGAWEWEIIPRSYLYNCYSLRGWQATTLAWAIFYSPGAAEDPGTAVHERAHLTQSLYMGPLYLPIYILLWIYKGYWNHPMEVQARRAEGRDKIV